jgi:hypothetical protein
MSIVESWGYDVSSILIIYLLEVQQCFMSLKSNKILQNKVKKNPLIISAQEMGKVAVSNTPSAFCMANITEQQKNP